MTPDPFDIRVLIRGGGEMASGHWAPYSTDSDVGTNPGAGAPCTRTNPMESSF